MGSSKLKLPSQEAVPRMTHPVENNTARGNGCHLGIAMEYIWAGLCRCWGKSVAETEGTRGASERRSSGQELMTWRLVWLRGELEAATGSHVFPGAVAGGSGSSAFTGLRTPVLGGIQEKTVCNGYPLLIKSLVLRIRDIT